MKDKHCIVWATWKTIHLINEAVCFVLFCFLLSNNQILMNRASWSWKWLNNNRSVIKQKFRLCTYALHKYTTWGSSIELSLEWRSFPKFSKMKTTTMIIILYAYGIHEQIRKHAHARFYLLASMYNLQLIRMRTKPNVAKNAPSHRPKFISSNMVSVIFAWWPSSASASFNSKLTCSFDASQTEFCSQSKPNEQNFKNIWICLCVFYYSLAHSLSFSQSVFSVYVSIRFVLFFFVVWCVCVCWVSLNRIVVLFALILCFYSFQFLSHVNWICTSIGVKMFAFSFSVHKITRQPRRKRNKKNKIDSLKTEGPHSIYTQKKKTLALIKIAYTRKSVYTQFVVVVLNLARFCYGTMQSSANGFTF